MVSEHVEQSNVVRWFRLQYPKLTMFAIPNGSHLAGDVRVRAIKMAKLKEEGLLPGASDLFLAFPSGKWHGLFIEMKSSRGKVSDEQSKFMKAVTDSGYAAYVCYGFDEAKIVIQDYLGNWTYGQGARN
jgi:hypothetical protein